MKKTLFQLFLLLLPTALALCALCLAGGLTGCKTEPDLPDDPHVPLVNPFVGVWKDDGGQYWQFRSDGTGGRAATQAGPFLDNFSFLIYAGQDVQTAPSQGSLAILDDSSGEGVDVNRYNFVVNGNRATLSPPEQSEQSIVMEQVSGDPQVLNLTNLLIGEWLADWTGSHGDSVTWSLKYRTDGTVKAFHHGSHQFENAYALRRNTLVIYGDWRFSIAPVIGELNPIENVKWQLTETQSNPAPARWVYTKVKAAKWKE